MFGKRYESGNALNRAAGISTMRLDSQIPIRDNGEVLVPIPLDLFPREYPHPYEKLGANYGGKSPYCLRQGVLERLIIAKARLQQYRSDLQIKIFDAYRPVEVQQFMVEYTFASILQARNLNVKELSLQHSRNIWEEVYQMWAVPSYDPRTPPPHSTGAAIDVTLADAAGKDIDMGGAIDELSSRSHPHYYARSRAKAELEYHAMRELLNRVMQEGGFYRHPNEWWHFSFGDRMWAWQHNSNHPDRVMSACYGRV